jgi:hypothetical protein
MPRPPELEKPPAGTGGFDSRFSFETPVYRREYRCDSNGASLRLLQVDDLRRRVLEKAACEVRQCPQTLSLWAFRLAQHVCRGTYGYGEAWATLELAALDAGVSQSRVTRVLYHGFADAVRLDVEAMPLSVLVSGVH